MRTTLDIEPDVLEAVKEISAKTKRTAGQVLSELARTALTSPYPRETPKVRNGFELIPSRGEVITAEYVRKLLEETEDA